MTRLKITSSNGTELYFSTSTFSYSTLISILNQMKDSTITISMVEEKPLNDKFCQEIEIKP